MRKLKARAFRPSGKSDLHKSSDSASRFCRHPPRYLSGLGVLTNRHITQIWLVRSPLFSQPILLWFCTAPADWWIESNNLVRVLSHCWFNKVAAAGVVYVTAFSLLKFLLKPSALFFLLILSHILHIWWYLCFSRIPFSKVTRSNMLTFIFPLSVLCLVSMLTNVRLQLRA